MCRQAILEVLQLEIIRMCLRDPFRRFSAFGKVWRRFHPIFMFFLSQFHPNSQSTFWEPLGYCRTKFCIIISTLKIVNVITFRAKCVFPVWGTALRAGMSRVPVPVEYFGIFFAKSFRPHYDTAVDSACKRNE